MRHSQKSPDFRHSVAFSQQIPNPTCVFYNDIFCSFADFGRMIMIRTLADATEARRSSREDDQVKLDSLDQAIVQTLVAEPRIPNAAIARRVGLSESAVAARINRLTAENTLRLTVERDARAEGFQIQAFARVETDIEEVDAAAEAICRLPEIDIVFGSVTPGVLTLIFFARDVDDFHAIVRRVEESSPHICFVSAQIAGDIYKYSTTYGLLS
ncbi:MULTISPECIES: Lrp/AsnC family transcriptional regulator [Sphingobium]|uniref:Lrp/AsnC family transcriptional regulator n=1 Tax=Sphingobium TaxID=165695 RepID=UPI00159C6928|nr:Lrp/AsnC family transcriptional regulator [Sphingobium sp. 15-1]